MADIADIDPAAFPDLNDDQIARLARYGTEREITAGTFLFQPGDDSYDFVVIVEGAIDIRTGNDNEVTIATHGARRFTGELSMLSGQRAYLSGLVVESGRAIMIDRAALREVFAAEPDVADVILRAFVLRRRYLEEGEGQLSLQLIGSRFSPSSRYRRRSTKARRITSAMSGSAANTSRSAARSIMIARPDSTTNPDR